MSTPAGPKLEFIEAAEVRSEDELHFDAVKRNPRFTASVLVRWHRH